MKTWICVQRRCEASLVRTRQIATLLSMMVFLLTATVAYGQEPKEITLSKEERELVKANNDFAFNLFRTARDKEQSLLLSPLSVTYALGMVNNGATATSKTREEINHVLGFGDAGADAINAFCRKLITETATLDEETKVMISNNIYVNSSRGYRLMPDFVEKVAKYYDVIPESRDFHDGQTMDVINRWASEHTEGMIDQVLDENSFNPESISYLLNALYFKGMWTHKFNKAYTDTRSFDGGKATAEMMSLEDNSDEFNYSENDTYQSIVLPYGNTAYQMTVFLPRQGKTIDDVLRVMNGETWASEWRNVYHVVLHFPRFETSTDMELNDIMAKLGMPNAFVGGEGFDAFCYEGDDVSQSHRCWIGKIKQTAKIKLDEEGTEAAAVTVIDMRDGVSEEPKTKEFNANRPFLYVISERSTGTIFFIGQYLGERITNPRKDITLTDEERELVYKNNDFAINLFREARGEESQVLSPLSITYALGMINNGAAGKTQQEINDVLGFGDAGADAINAFCRKMLTESGNVDKETKVMIANNIYMNKDYELQEPFIQKAYDYYDATPETRDFLDGETMDVINQWASDHTEGMIKEILNEDTYNPFAVSYLLNAIYFKGGWVSEFDPKNTVEEPFNGGSNVFMMHQNGQFGYDENETYQVVYLPYGNEAYQMSVFLPRKDKTIDDVLEQLKGNKTWIYGGRADVDLKLPRMKIETHIQLNDIMCALGMPRAFDMFQAEFPYFCNVPIYIGRMRQVAKMDVDEKGTEAAAVTIIEGKVSGMPRSVTFHADRPFVYIISEKSTNAIFFIGQYMGDAKATNPNSVVLPSNIKNTAPVVYNLQGQRLQTPPARGVYIVGGKKVVGK